MRKLAQSIHSVKESQNLHFLNDSAYYQELTSRNRHFVSEATQKKLQNLKVFVAGCGAAGGACIEPLVRLGITHLRLADNGAYDVSNLNRQHAFYDQVGKNKATFHSEEVLRINPYVDVQAYPEGVTEKNLTDLIGWADLVIDAVDVTVQESIQLKFRLHELAHQLKKPVLTPLDPGYCQMGEVFDYRWGRISPIAGRLEACRKTLNPIHGLLTLFPLRTMPNHSLRLIVDLLENSQIPASQLGCSADLLSAVISAIVLKFAATNQLPKGWRMDVAPLALTIKERMILQWQGIFLRFQIKKLLRQISR